MTWAFEQRISGNEKIVLLCLADFADDNGTCFPGQQRIAWKASISLRTLTRVMASLEEKGFITRERRRTDHGTRTSDLYHLNVALSANVSPDKTGKSYLPTVAVTKDPSEEPSEKLRAPRKKETPTPLPSDWAPNDSHRALATERRLDVTHEANIFRLHAETNGRKAVRWNAAFTMWLTKATPRQPGTVGAPPATKRVVKPFHDPYMEMSTDEFRRHVGYVEPGTEG